MSPDEAVALLKHHCAQCGGKDYFPPAWAVSAIMKAYQAGALAMRERAAKVCEGTGPDDWTGENCAERVRALPVEE